MSRYTDGYEPDYSRQDQPADDPYCGECRRTFALLEPRGASHVKVASRDLLPKHGSICRSCRALGKREAA